MMRFTTAAGMSSSAPNSSTSRLNAFASEAQFATSAAVQARLARSCPGRTKWPISCAIVKFLRPDRRIDSRTTIAPSRRSLARISAPSKPAVSTSCSSSQSAAAMARTSPVCAGVQPAMLAPRRVRGPTDSAHRSGAASRFDQAIVKKSLRVVGAAFDVLIVFLRRRSFSRPGSDLI